MLGSSSSWHHFGHRSRCCTSGATAPSHPRWRRAFRVEEALDLEVWAIVNLNRGTITITESKTDSGVRVVDVAPALCEEFTE